MARVNSRPTHASRRQQENSESESESSERSYSPGKENHAPSVSNRDKQRVTQEQAPRRAAMSPLTPSTTSISNSARGQKRKRTPADHTPTVEAESPQEIASGEEDEVEERDTDEQHFNRYFDPNQDPEKRQHIKRQSRALRRDFNETREELLKGDASALTATIHRADQVFRGVKQTADATIDSRLLVDVSELAYKKTRELVVGTTTTGIDPDLFLTKCLSYLRNHNPSTTSTQPNSTRHDSDSDSDSSTSPSNTTLAWSTFGLASFSTNSRPSLPTFLLGPLSVTRKPRLTTSTQRTTRASRLARETAPESLSAAQLANPADNGASLTQTCTRIARLLSNHVRKTAREARDAGIADWRGEEGRKWLKNHRVSSNGSPGLLEWIADPNSFGRTVENLFYTSFLIKEGVVGVGFDEGGLPTLQPAPRGNAEGEAAAATAKRIKKHQAILSIDYETWRKVVEAYDIKEPMIPRMEDEQDIGASGWYR